MFLLLSPISHTISKSPLLSETTCEYKAENLVPISRNCRYFRFSLRNAEFQGQSLKIKNLVTLYSVQRIESRLKSPIRFGRQVPVLRSRVRYRLQSRTQLMCRMLNGFKTTTTNQCPLNQARHNLAIKHKKLPVSEFKCKHTLLVGGRKLVSLCRASFKIIRVLSRKEKIREIILSTT